ncbi:MAG: hypothetical protein BroJett040_23330 [Oligoflexia bacterium]|nr:MAG: hypothetical protein BroJett040_23330 [Oligoflexia bacterium]
MGRYKPKIHSNYEFELDLAPLLAVMVKLVPVLLISSAFVQVMMIETDLPQAVKEAIARQDDKKMASIQLDISQKNGIRIIVEEQGKQQVESVPNKSEGQYDLETLHAQLTKIKIAHPEVFRIELAPEPNVAYKDIVKIMDEARRARDRNITFPVQDSKTGKQIETNYMFPDVAFVNMMEG